ncbi:MAG: hypothetical protein ISS15_12210 [Alphaproteobacteria bacterium]|nr:hypothetical protein [Alphaproteobacteria bacterium]MBL6936535.1 hypothetical protein [Alphaproteobacteria bacterium]MBL7098414.1 hypothetical protein [Alphaproteobacteria bacterium]
MPKVVAFLLWAVFGALLMIDVSESDWPMAALMGVALGLSTALFVYVYPKDLAPPADEHSEKLLRRRAEMAKTNLKRPA